MTVNAQYFSFGSGLLTARPLGTNQTPVPFGALQDVTLEVAGSTKTIYGQNQFALAAARGEIKLTCKAKIGQINGPIYNNLFFGSTSAVGTTLNKTNEGPSAIPTTPFQITVVNGATMSEDLGVLNSATGVPFVRVAAAPTAGQYSVNEVTGVYTFAAADNVSAISVLISYNYTSATIGSTQNLLNPVQGVQPVFSCIITRMYNGVGERYKLWSCIAGKLSLPTKMADFAISEFDFECFADSANRTVSVYTDV